MWSVICVCTLNKSRKCVDACLQECMRACARMCKLKMFKCVWVDYWVNVMLFSSDWVFEWPVVDVSYLSESFILRCDPVWLPGWGKKKIVIEVHVVCWMFSVMCQELQRDRIPCTYSVLLFWQWLPYTEKWKKGDKPQNCMSLILLDNHLKSLTLNATPARAAFSLWVLSFAIRLSFIWHCQPTMLFNVRGGGRGQGWSKTSAAAMLALITLWNQDILETSWPYYGAVSSNITFCMGGQFTSQAASSDALHDDQPAEQQSWSRNLVCKEGVSSHA